MGAVLLQIYGSVETRNEEAQEKSGKNCEFENFLEVMRLRPIYFISRSTVSPLENSSYIFVGESSTVNWAIEKFRTYLWVTELAVLSDCSVMQKTFKSEAIVPHMLHRWRAEFFQYQFVI